MSSDLPNATDTGQVDEWMREPGARVQGHAARLEPSEGRLRVACGCGYRSFGFATQASACLLLVVHLQAAVRGGARVAPGDDDGLAGVREPRRPVPPYDQSALALAPEHD